jgi:hypothetical protein
MSFDSDEAVASELILYLDNDEPMYRQKKAIIENLTKKFNKGTYDHKLAPKIWSYLVESAAKKYVKEHGSPGDRWFQIFDVAVRKVAAKELADRWYKLVKAGYPDEG